MRALPSSLACALILAACSSSTPAPPASGSPAAEAPAPGPGRAVPAAEPEAGSAAAQPPSAAPIEAGAKAELGKPAPDFALVDLEGATHRLSDHAGKIVVLEWFNPECPFVNYAHTEGPLKTLAAEQSAEGVVWLAVNSGAPGKQGHDPAVNRAGVEKFGMKHPVLRDEAGAVGRAYGALKTPHVYVIDAAGVLQYAGGVDNAPFGEVDGEGPVRGHLVEALADVRAGTAVRQNAAPPWGCGVKYAS